MEAINVTKLLIKDDKNVEEGFLQSVIFNLMHTANFSDEDYENDEQGNRILGIDLKINGKEVSFLQVLEKLLQDQSRTVVSETNHNIVQFAHQFSDILDSKLERLKVEILQEIFPELTNNTLG